MMKLVWRFIKTIMNMAGLLMLAGVYIALHFVILAVLVVASKVNE